MSAPGQSPAPPSAPAADCRCPCGSLLARLVPGGVEVKCRRCKRTVVVPLAAPLRSRGARLRPAVEPRP